jgi:hypothetical protein
MKLLRLGTGGFGGLRGYFRFDPSRLTVVVDDNERGKTTMLAAITAALYGLGDDRRSHRLVTPLERWRPWDGSSYDVEVEVESGGNRYTVSRDFDRCTVDIRDGAGRDVAAEFREGKDGYPVGQKLLGLDADEFEKCAFVRQGDLYQVVPSDEKERRDGTLRGRLEAAADSRLGDSRASDALRVIDGALRRYTCPELEFTGTAENAIQRLATKEALLETEIKTLEHDYAQIERPLAELAELTEREKSTRAALEEIENARRARMAAEARAQLEEHRRRRAEVDALRREAEDLARCAGVPLDAEGQLREAVAKLDAAQSKLADLEKARAEDLERERGRLEEELRAVRAFESGTVVDADRCVTLAGELRRMSEDDSRLRDEVFHLREALASGGHDGDRLQWLSHRLGGLSDAHQALLRRQSERALDYQTEVAGLENQRTVSSETLRSIDSQRSAMSLPGWFLLALGFAGVLAGSVVVALQGLPALSTTFFVAGAVVLGAGVALSTAGRQHRADEREDAVAALAEAQRRLGQLRQQRAETESEMESLAREMGYRDHVELLKEWGEIERLRAESSPAVHAQQQLASLEGRRQRAMDEARALLVRFGDAPATAEALESVAGQLRHASDLRRQLASLDPQRPWMEDQKRADEVAAAGFRERALRILESAGISYDPRRSWEDVFHDLAERTRGNQRYATLVDELIPAAEKRLLPQPQVAELESRAAMASEGATAEESRTAAEDEAQGRVLREQFEELQRRRSDLRVAVEERSRRHLAEMTKKVIELQRYREAGERARRFREAAQLAASTIQSVATETHRRWAEFLNHRVAELLQGVGTRIQYVRFGDDLDFSVQMPGAKPLPRGKADPHLSCAARDQLYLAVRLAISEYLSRGREPLPLLLDDVFATSDDERSRAGMRTLIERFEGHQIVLTTCHRQRYERLAELDPELYAQRVQFLDTRSSVVR